MNQLVQRQGPLTAAAMLAVVGESPAGIKRQAPAMHLQAAQQRLKPRQRCEHVQSIDLSEQLLNRALRQHNITELGGIFLAITGTAEAGHNIRMRFVNEISLRLRRPHRRQQGTVTAQARGAIAD